MKNNTIGYGSFFHLDDASIAALETKSVFKENYLLFYAGRFAMKYIFQLIENERSTRTIWLPQYYCPFVKNWLAHEFSNLAYYQSDPFIEKIDIDFSQFKENDVVVVNNFWGIKENILPKTRSYSIIEDHSHAWGSLQSLNSEADFCIASLRKTLPIPLGGIAWKPKKSTSKISLVNSSLFNNDNRQIMDKAWQLYNKAMLQKANYSVREDEKVYLKTYNEAENTIRNFYNITPLTKFHLSILKLAMNKDYNLSKATNLKFVMGKLKMTTHFKVLSFSDYVPFGLLLVFKDLNILLDLKKHLIANDIYPAELWPDNSIDQEYKYLLNIHLDYRYDEQDASYISSIINQWSSTH